MRSSKEAKGTSLSGSCRGLVVTCMVVVVLVVAAVLAMEVEEDSKSGWEARGDGAAPPLATRSSKKAKGTSLGRSCRDLAVMRMVVLVLVVAVVLAAEVQEDNKSNHSNESRWRTRGAARTCSSTKENSSKCRLGSNDNRTGRRSNKSSRKEKGTQEYQHTDTGHNNN